MSMPFGSGFPLFSTNIFSEWEFGGLVLLTWLSRVFSPKYGLYQEA